MDGAEVKVVLGSDVTEIVIPRKVREGPKGSPYGIKTKLGWAVTGNLPGYARNSESVYFVHVASPEEELNELVKTWWKTESFGCKYDSTERRSREDEMVLELLSKTTHKVDGRYEVGLIWNDSATALPNNRVVAERRLELLEKRLDRDPQLKVKCTETIENDLHKEYIKNLGDQEVQTLSSMSGTYRTTLCYILTNPERFGESVMQQLDIKELRYMTAYYLGQTC